MTTYSDFKIVNSKAMQIYGKPVFVSTRKDKKFMIKNDNDKFIHFGQLGYEDFSKHKDEKRRQSYLTRAKKIKGSWKQDKYSPNMLAIKILWNG